MKASIMQNGPEYKGLIVVSVYDRKNQFSLDESIIPLMEK